MGMGDFQPPQLQHLGTDQSETQILETRFNYIGLDSNEKYAIYSNF